MAPGNVWHLRGLYTTGVISVLSAGDALSDGVACVDGPDIPLAGGCDAQDHDGDNDVDMNDFAALQACVTNPTGMLVDGCLGG